MGCGALSKLYILDLSFRAESSLCYTTGILQEDEHYN